MGGSLQGRTTEGLKTVDNVWMSIAEKKLDFCSKDGVAENSEIGRERILEYFAATDFGQANALGFDGEPLAWACAFVSWVWRFWQENGGSLFTPTQLKKPLFSRCLISFKFEDGNCVR